MEYTCFTMFYCTTAWISGGHTHIPSLWGCPPTPLGRHRPPSWAPCAEQARPAGFCFTHGSVCMSVPISHFIPPSPFPPCPESILYICVSILTLQIGSPVPFSWFYIHVLIYNVFLFWLHSVWQTLASSASLKMTQFHSFLWLFRNSLERIEAVFKDGDAEGPWTPCLQWTHQMDSDTEQLALKKLTHLLSTSYKMRDRDNAYVEMSRKGWDTLLLKPQQWHRALQLKGNSQMPASPWGMKGLDPIATTPCFKIPTQRPPDRFLALKVNGVWIHQFHRQREAKQQLLKAQALTSAIPSRSAQIKPTSQSPSGWGLLGYFKCCCLRVKPLSEHLSRGWLRSSPKVPPLPALSVLLQVARALPERNLYIHICTPAFVATGSRWVPRSAVYDSHQGVPSEARKDNRGGSKLDILLPLGLSREGIQKCSTPSPVLKRVYLSTSKASTTHSSILGHFWWFRR